MGAAVVHGGRTIGRLTAQQQLVDDRPAQAGSLGRAGAAAARRAQCAQHGALPRLQGNPDQCRIPHDSDAVSSRPRARNPRHVVPPLGRRALRSADWRGEYHQPRARTIERAHEGDGDAAGTRRRTVDPRPADPDGDAAADGPRRHRRSRAGTLGPDDADGAGDVGDATGQRDPDGLRPSSSSRSRWRSSSASSSGWRPSSTCATST